MLLTACGQTPRGQTRGGGVSTGVGLSWPRKLRCEVWGCSAGSVLEPVGASLGPLVTVTLAPHPGARWV